MKQSLNRVRRNGKAATAPTQSPTTKLSAVPKPAKVKLVNGYEVRDLRLKLLPSCWRRLEQRAQSKKCTLEDIVEFDLFVAKLAEEKSASAHETKGNAKAVPTPEDGSLYVKQPRNDGHPGQYWEWDNPETVEEIEGLSLVASNDAILSAIYERADGSLVFHWQRDLSDVCRWKDIDFREAALWVQDWMAPLEIRGQFGKRIVALCLEKAPEMDTNWVEDKLNKIEAILGLAFERMIDPREDDRQTDGKTQVGCMHLLNDTKAELAEILDRVCDFWKATRGLIAKDSEWNEGWKQLGPALKLEEAA